MTNKKGQGNIHSVQLLRGIAALMVVISHSVGSETYLPKAHYVRQLCSYGWSGVEMFFIISGFIIPYSMYKNHYKQSEFGSLMLRRIVRIEPPYLLSIAIFIVLNYLIYFTPIYRGSGTVAPMDWWNVLGHIGYVNAFTGKPWLTAVYWTLAVEFEYYIAISLLFPLIVHTNNAIRRVTHAGLLLIAAYAMMRYAVPANAPLYNGHLPVFLPYFLMGIVLFMLRCNIIAKKEFFTLIAGSILVLLLFEKVNAPLLIGISLISLYAIHYIKNVPKFFIFLGMVSYSLYLTHSLVINRIVVLLGKVTGNKYMGIRLAACVVVCIGVAWVYYKVAEKPFTELSKKIKYAVKKQRPAPEFVNTKT